MTVKFAKQHCNACTYIHTCTHTLTGTPYSLVGKNPFGMGLAHPDAEGHMYLCSNTYGQRHPTTGDVIFVHRGGAKYTFANDYLKLDPIPRAWSHIAKQGPKSKSL